MEFITFLLAPIGYACLALITVLAAHGRFPSLLSSVTVGIIVVHVLLVWHVRYGWLFSEATRNGYAGFLIFHAALLAIVASRFVPRTIERRLLTGAFVIVTLGAIAATAKYDVVQHYRWPVIVIALVGAIGIVYRPAIALIGRFAA